jgi:hypothetical protein
MTDLWEFEEKHPKKRTLAAKPVKSAGNLQLQVPPKLAI